MSRLKYILLASAIACTPVTLAQTPGAASRKSKTKTSIVSPQSAPQLNKVDEDHGCESQVLPEVLAIVNGARITREDIEEQIKETVVRLQGQIIEARKRELDLQINSKLVAVEAKRRAVSIPKLLEEEVMAKVQEPTELETRAFYAQNKDRNPGEFNDVKNDIVRYLREQRQTVEAKKFAERLRVVVEIRVQIQEAIAPKKAADRARVFAIVDGQQITSADIEDSLRPLVHAVQEQVYRLRKDKLDLRINDTLLEQAAQKRQMTTNSLLDAEIKPKIITEEDARAFYEHNKDRVSGDFSQTKDSIIRYLQQGELRSAELAFVEKLRDAASIQTFLVAPQLPAFNTTRRPAL